jgi:hypothetical protein
MSIATIVIALIWGAISGYLLIRFIDNLAAAGLCVDGLLRGRWQRLGSKAHTGLVNPNIILRLMLRVTLYAILCGVILQVGHSFVRREFDFEYSGIALIIYAVTAIAMAASRLPAVRQRLKIIWRMTHEHDYAERRRRTQMLKR